MNKRIIIFLELDCFELQVWLNKLRPDLIGKDVPVVVVNPKQEILSLNYTAESLGVVSRRSLLKARTLCTKKGNELIEIEAGKHQGKEDPYLPQVESDKIFEAIQTFQTDLGRKSSSVLIERSRRDKFYIDVTSLIQNSLDQIPSRSEINQLFKPKNRNLSDKNHGTSTTIMETSESEPITGEELFNRIHDEREKSNEHLEELSLVNGAIIAQKLIDTIKIKTGYEASAGIAHSKFVAKLGCSRNKPEGITIIANSSHQRLQSESNLQDHPGFGSETVSQIKKYYKTKENKTVATIKQLLEASNDGEDFEYALKELGIADADIRAKNLFERCHFLDEKPVIPFVHQKTLSTSMTFKGDETWEEFKDKIKDLCKDMQKRMNNNTERGRKAEKLIIKTTMFQTANANIFRTIVNTIQLGQDSSRNVINSNIHQYLKANRLYHKNIWSIKLTTKD